MDENKSRRDRLKAIIEANRISRLSEKVRTDIYNDLIKKKKTAKGAEARRISILLDVISEKQEKEEIARMNQTYAEYNDGCGFGFGSGSSCDNG